jgi:HTH-type transcriptional regulator/antitoxin HigA
VVNRPPEELRYEPDYVGSPGASLRSTLAVLGMTQADLAARTGLSLKHINQIVQGVAPITPETALAFEKVTAVPARTWNSLESSYRDHLARMEDTKATGSDSEWLRTLPIRELKARGKLPDTRDTGLLLQAVFRFFGVANRQAWERLWRAPLASFRKSNAFRSDPPAVAAWLRLGEIEAAGIACEPFDQRRFRETLRTIRSLTTQLPELFQDKVVRLCANAGVAVVFVPEIKGSRVSGAAHWLTTSKAVIQLSLRYKSDDHLWFSFFHEAAHILLHSKREIFITENKDQDLVEEDEANEFAETFLIPKRYVGELFDLRSKADILGFSESLGIAPGIVVGRLQKEGILDWRTDCNQLKRRFRFVEE